MSDTEKKPKKTASQASAWLAKFGIQGGGWYQEVKISVQHAMRSARFSESARVWLCLRLHTIPYKSELAMKTVRDPETDKPTPIRLTPADVAEETGMNRNQVRFGMAELEEEGMAERRAIDGTDLRKGNVELYCWVVPHPPHEGKIVSVPGYNLPPEILTAIRHFHIRLPVGFVGGEQYISNVKKALAGYKTAEKVARDALKAAFFVSVEATTYKEDRNPGIEEADRVPSSSSVGRSVGDRPTDKIKAAIPAKLRQKVQDTETPQLLQKIADQLRDAPPENLTARIHARWDSITSLGMLVHLAADVYKAFHEEPPVPKQPPRRPPVQETREEKLNSLRNAIETYQGIAEDERKPPGERENMRTRVLNLRTELQALEANGVSHESIGDHL